MEEPRPSPPASTDEDLADVDDLINKIMEARENHKDDPEHEPGE